MDCSYIPYHLRTTFNCPIDKIELPSVYLDLFFVIFILTILGIIIYHITKRLKKNKSNSQKGSEM